MSSSENSEGYDLPSSCTTKTYDWSDSIEHILDMVRLNCVHLSEYHNYKYQVFKSRLAYFRVPLIILSAVNAYIAIGLNAYVKQPIISTANGVISLICGIITSMEMFLNIQKRMENELLSHKQFYILSVQIFKIISIDRQKRKMDGKVFLDSKFSEYETLIQNSNALDSKFKGDLLTQPEPLIHPSVEEKERSNSLLSAIDNLRYLYQPKMHQLRKRNTHALKLYREVLLNDIKTNQMEAGIKSTEVEEVEEKVEEGVMEDQKPVSNANGMKFYANPFHNPYSYDHYMKGFSKEDKPNFSRNIEIIKEERAKIIELVQKENVDTETKEPAQEPQPQVSDVV